jgi:hypothetical protein
MHLHSKDYRSRRITVDPSTSSFLSSWTTAIPEQLESSQEMCGDPPEFHVVTGLTKTEAESLLDWLEAAGHGLCQLSYVNGEGFSILPFPTLYT